MEYYLNWQVLQNMLVQYSLRQRYVTCGKWLTSEQVSWFTFYAMILLSSLEWLCEHNVIGVWLIYYFTGRTSRSVSKFCLCRGGLQNSGSSWRGQFWSRAETVYQWPLGGTGWPVDSIHASNTRQVAATYCSTTIHCWSSRYVFAQHFYYDFVLIMLFVEPFVADYVNPHVFE